MKNEEYWKQKEARKKIERAEFRKAIHEMAPFNRLSKEDSAKFDKMAQAFVDNLNKNMTK